MTEFDHFMKAIMPFIIIFGLIYSAISMPRNKSDNTWGLFLFFFIITSFNILMYFEPKWFMRILYSFFELLYKL